MRRMNLRVFKTSQDSYSHHGVLVCAAHALGGVSLDPEEGEQVVRGAEGAGVLDRVRAHPVTLLTDVHPSGGGDSKVLKGELIKGKKCLSSPVVVVGSEALHHHLPLR